MIWGDQADQSHHLGAVKALKKDLVLDEAGPDHLHMFYKLLDMIPAEQCENAIPFWDLKTIKVP